LIIVITLSEEYKLITYYKKETLAQEQDGSVHAGRQQGEGRGGCGEKKERL
jgi:hypothetical protein